ncbi:Adenylate and Guanylate cyclase catalytic domain-containing protein [Nannocystis exedens]|uniref:Adenylate and Guanylate cyclase catalytic domain-containing protein n=1 Tax=Nannocystis exedens TaxID=54 RepID=A0A1I1T0S1_9BACT|nr:Adenylate cyclase 2 [Nannocystis exedens]SFD52191.1 Adenylate and Guanylate cyclase catalytic domain-containing protein [Nannocystis exedens]
MVRCRPTLPELFKALASYIPAIVTRRLSVDPRPLHQPQAEIVAAAVLCADVSGFTALTEALAKQGPAGVEKVAAGLNTYFGRLIEITAAHGGDVVKFAGDALTAVWVAEGSSARAAEAAVACGLAIQAALHACPIDDGIELSLRIGVAAGRIALVHVGGLGGRWELVLVGPAIEAVRRAQTFARPGEVVIDKRVWTMLGGRVDGESRGEHGFGRVVALREPVVPSPLVRPQLPDAAEAALRGYVPPAVIARLSAGQSSFLAELRRLSVLFINFPDLKHQTPLMEAQEVMIAVQQIVESWEGTIGHLSVDDHGTTVLVAFGLPPLAHEDDPVRAIEAAQQVRELHKRLGWRATCGIASGRAFCGTVGSAERCEYTVLGDVVNLAARLMQAGDGKAVLCDHYTFVATRGQFLFEGLPPISVKGKEGTISIYTPASARLPGRSQKERAVSGPLPVAGGARAALVGRMRERGVLINGLHEVLRGRSATIVVEGEAGLGKTRLADDLLEQAEAAGAMRLLGAREISDAAGPYHAWLPIFATIFGLNQGTDQGSDPWQRVVSGLRRLVPAAVSRAPLLGAVLPIDAVDNDRTAPLQGRARAEQTRVLLVQILLAYLKGNPAVLLLEDAQRFDSASWALLADVREEVQPLLCVIVTGPVDSDTAAAELRQILADHGTYHLQLQPLSLVETENLVCRRLGVSRLPPEVASFIYERAEGHPFFSEELASALRDAGFITIWNGECLLSHEAGDLRTAKFPDNLEAVITSRIDRLQQQHQLVLKVGAVLGRVFSLSLLRAIYPIEADKAQLPEYLQALERRGLLVPKPHAAEGTFLFKHALTQEVAYNLLPFAQRQQLHQAVAEHFERAHGSKLELYYPLLAHHWYRVVASSALVPGGGRPSPELIGRAVLYLQRAGEQAIRNDAGQEAVQHYSHAIELLRHLPESPERVEQEIGLQIGLGNAQVATLGFGSDEVEQTFARARELCREVGDTRHLFPVLFGLWQHYVVRAQLDVARELAEQMLMFAERRRQRVPLLVSHRGLGTQLFHQGDFERSRAHLERSIVLYAPDFDRNLGHLYIHDPRIAALAILSLTLWMLGRTAEALERSRVSIALARELGHGFSTTFALVVASILRQILRDVEGARTHADQVYQLKAEATLGAWVSFADAIRAWAMAELGQHDEGLDLLRQALIELQAAGMGMFMPWTFSVFADLCIRAGRIDEGLSVIGEAMESSRLSGARWWEAELMRQRAEILHEMGEVEEAALLLHEALELAREQGARALELRAGLSMARLFPDDPSARARLKTLHDDLVDKVDDMLLAALAAAAAGG